MQTNSNELTSIIPVKKVIMIDGEAVVIEQIKMGAIPALLSAMYPIAHMLTDQKPFDIKEMFMSHASDCLTVLEVLSGKTTEWIAALEIDAGIYLFSELLEANLDFFIQKVLPMLTGVMERINAKLQVQSAGQNSFNC